MKHKILAHLIIFLFSLNYCKSQEIIASVNINADQVVTTDKKIFTTLKTELTNFLNNRKWTSDEFTADERIELNLTISITERVSINSFKSTLSVTARRPAYKTDYKTQTFNHIDEEFQFDYVEYQALDYNENSFATNLTQVLAFYTYLVIAVDYDTFSLNGGTPYYQKALAQVNNAQAAPGGITGWKAYESTKNRYWLAEGFLNPNFKILRTTLYEYHRLGLDVMYDQPKLQAGKDKIAESIEALKTIHNRVPGSLLMQEFFQSKFLEITNIFSESLPAQKSKLYQTLILIDPGNTARYEKLRQ